MPIEPRKHPQLGGCTRGAPQLRWDTPAFRAATQLSEGKFIPYHLARTLSSTGNWGAVRVIPAGLVNVDVIISGEILESNGKSLVVKITVRDARGELWFSRKLKAEANPLAYHNEELQISDPYQTLYNRIANDLLAERQNLTAEEITELRRISNLIFAADLAPYAFDDYLETDKKGRYTIERVVGAVSAGHAKGMASRCLRAS